MGVTFHQARSLWEARVSGMRCDRMVMIAHQQLFLHPRELAAFRAAHQESGGRQAAPPLADYTFGDYIDRYCRECLGAAGVEIVDYSAYEGATIIHDMNQPIPEHLHDRFDVVLEAGSLEHIFNFPVAIANIMKLTKVGGAVFLTTPANNLCGHGFYQFSPELMFRIFSNENGFDAPAVELLQADFPGVELTPARHAFEVVDPGTIGRRVGLLSKRPVMMMVRARKVRHVEPFQTAPQQSDYLTLWKQESPLAGRRNMDSGREVLKRIARKLPQSWMRQFRGYRSNVECSLSNANFYRKIR